MTTAYLNALAEIAQLRARVSAYEAALDEIVITTDDKRARGIASGVLSDYTEERTNERGTV